VAKSAYPDHTIPSSPYLCGEIEGSRLHHWLPTPLGAHLLCGTRFLASACSWEAPYQNCAFWHIAQTAYLCCCLGLLAGSELPRTPSWRSSKKPLHSNHDLTSRLSHSLLLCASAGDPGGRTRGIGEPTLRRRVLPPGTGTPHHHSHSFTVPGFPPARVVSPRLGALSALPCET
jgi:hypothetical protein